MHLFKIKFICPNLLILYKYLAKDYKIDRENLVSILFIMIQYIYIVSNFHYLINNIFN